MKFLLNWLTKDERAGCFALFVFLVSRDCCVALSHDAMGLPAVCDCGISRMYSLTIFYPIKRGIQCVTGSALDLRLIGGLLEPPRGVVKMSKHIF